MLRVSYSSAFRSPNAYEQYYDTDDGYSGNKNLHPEKIQSTEISYDQYFGDYFRANVTGFYNYIEGLLTQSIDQSDNSIIYGNIGSNESKGVELEVESKLDSGFMGRVNYTRQKTTHLDTGRPMENSPRDIVKGVFTAPIPLGKTSLTLEGNYFSSRLNMAGDSIPGATVFNLTLVNRDLLAGLDLSASIYNLFDERYGYPTSSDFTNSEGKALKAIEQDGRTFRLKADLRF